MADKALSVSDLTPAPYNPRHISDTALESLKKAMKEFGDLSGIVFNRRTCRLIGGHQRVKGLDPSWPIVKVPVSDAVGTVAEGYIETPFGRWLYREVEWPEAKEKAANIAANKHGGEWDIPAMKDLLVELDTGAFDLLLTGFDEAELKKLIDWDGYKGSTPEDDVPGPPKTAITKPGDLILLGDHRVLCGDATKNDDAVRVMRGMRATLVFTDPPYGVGIGKKNVMLNSFQKAGRNLDDLAMDDFSHDELGKMLLSAFRLWRGFMADDCSVFVCSPQGGGLGMMMLMMMRDAGLEIRHIVNWAKNSPTFSMGRLDYDYQHEPILFTWTKTHKRKRDGAFQTSLWSVNKPLANKEHPTMKPVALPENAVLNHSDHGDVVVDMFMGSGTTLIASEKHGRHCFGLEINPIYCDVIVDRWENFTGKKAVRT